MHELRPSWTSLTKEIYYCYRRGSIKLSDVFLKGHFVIDTSWVYFIGFSLRINMIIFIFSKKLSVTRCLHFSLRPPKTPPKQQNTYNSLKFHPIKKIRALFTL